MSAHPHLLRLLKFIRLLADRPGRTVSQFARTLETSERTVYRYLDTLQKLGYLIDKDEQDHYFLFEADAARRPSFTADESALVDRLLSSLPAELPLTDSIRRKLFLTSDLVPFADELLDRHQALVIERLATALREGRQVSQRKSLKDGLLYQKQIVSFTARYFGFPIPHPTLTKIPNEMD